ncbi:hypothetical protein ACFFX0_07380 [Citricoccus parietis]|uniref:Uncharacterized protein n=1 Tax=Citricoccus parietis TaxID=592307 RepID=A0ABV5FWH5_9MICC
MHRRRRCGASSPGRRRDDVPGGMSPRQVRPVPAHPWPGLRHLCGVGTGSHSSGGRAPCWPRAAQTTGRTSAGSQDAAGRKASPRAARRYPRCRCGPLRSWSSSFPAGAPAVGCPSSWSVRPLGPHRTVYPAARSCLRGSCSLDES